jgi:hypothetical protein
MGNVTDGEHTSGEATNSGFWTGGSHRRRIAGRTLRPLSSIIS